MMVRFYHYYKVGSKIPTITLYTQNTQHNTQQHEEKHLDNCSIAAADTDCQR